MEGRQIIHKKEKEKPSLFNNYFIEVVVLEES